VNPFEAISDIVITPAGARRLRDGHLWIYASDVVSESPPEPPDIARILDAAGNGLGFAMFSPLSQIRLRLLRRGAEPPTAEWLRERLGEAIGRRVTALTAGGACRLVYGEADLLPSIIVDRYDDYLVLQTLSHGAEALKPVLVDALCGLLTPKGILERNDLKARLLEGLPESHGVLWGEAPGPIRIEEAGVAFEVDVAGGQKTGFFLDQSENRVAARRYARGCALDCFTNTGAFALHFARSCESVLGVDISAQSLELARRNAWLNQASNVDFQEANVFDFLREMDRAGRRFDLVCLDPPAFAKSRASVSGARHGYKEINLRAFKLLRPEGILISSSCSYHLTEWDFFSLIAEAARDAHRQVQVIERRSQASDHPVLASMPETHYLKCFILRVL